MLCRCGHDKDWHAEGGTADCEHNAECPCEKFDPAPVAATIPAFSVGQLVAVSYMGETYEGVICEIVEGGGRQRLFYKVDLGPQLGKPAYEEHEIEMPQ